MSLALAVHERVEVTLGSADHFGGAACCAGDPGLARYPRRVGVTAFVAQNIGKVSFPAPVPIKLTVDVPLQTRKILDRLGQASPGPRISAHIQTEVIDDPAYIPAEASAAIEANDPAVIILDQANADILIEILALFF